jgi:hypothetical protein
MLTHNHNLKMADEDRRDDLPSSPGSMSEGEMISELEPNTKPPRKPSSTPGPTSATKRKAEQDQQARRERYLRRSRGPEDLGKELQQVDDQQKATPREPVHPRKRVRTPSDTRDAPLSPRNEPIHIFSESEDSEGDVPANKPRSCTPTFETSTYLSTATLAAQNFRVSDIHSTINLGGDNTFTGEAPRSDKLKSAATTDHGVRVDVSDGTIRGVVPLDYTDPNRKKGKTPRSSGIPRGSRHASLSAGDINCVTEVAPSSSGRPPTAADSHANTRCFTAINANQHLDADLTLPTQQSNCEDVDAVHEHGRDHAIGADADTNDVTKDQDDDTDAWASDENELVVSARDSAPALALDQKAEIMLSHIINLARSPREWLDFLSPADYHISRGCLIAKDAGHLENAKDVLQYLIHRISDAPGKKYERLIYEYEAIWVDLNTAGAPKTFCTPQIWEPFSVLVNTDPDKTLDSMSFADKVAVCIVLWRDIVNKLPFLFSDRTLQSAPRRWSFVVLLVLTCAPQEELCDALGISTISAEYNSVVRKQVFDLLDHLCIECEEFQNLTAPEVLQIWDCLHKKFLMAYKNGKMPVADDARVRDAISEARAGEGSGGEVATEARDAAHVRRCGKKRKAVGKSGN